MQEIQDLFLSPELHPIEIDFRRRVVKFVRISRAGFQRATFLGAEAAKRVGSATFEMRLDDVLLIASALPPARARVHYTFHTAYCCSTLLARYFELLPSCFVLKEPQLLSQLATTPYRHGARRFPEIVEACVQLLTRTYDAGQLVMIKPNVPCNFLGPMLLERNQCATVSFLFTALKQFVLAVLKSQLRRDRISAWNQTSRAIAAQFFQLAGIRPWELSDAEAAAYSWLVNRLWFEQLLATFPSRVIASDGDLLASSPQQALPPVLRLCGIELSETELQALTGHSSVQRHSKHADAYDGSSRAQDMSDIAERFGIEADAAVEWAQSHGFSEEMLCCPKCPAPQI